MQHNADTCVRGGRRGRAEVGEAGLGGEHLRLTCRSENVSATPKGRRLQIKEHLWRSPTLGRNGQVLYSHSAWSLLEACPGKTEADFAAQMPRGCQLTAPCNPTGSYISKGDQRGAHPAYHSHRREAI